MSHNFDADNKRTIDELEDDISDEIIKTSRIILRTEDINFTGGLSDKIRKYKIGKFKYIVYDSPYAEFVEDGMPPGEYIDMSKLRKWVRGKLGIKDEEVLSIVTGNIYRKIKDEGIAPKKFLDKSLDYVIKKWGTRDRSRQARRSNTIKKVIKTTKAITRVVSKINKFVKRLG